MIRCLNCMEMYDETANCPHCGFSNASKPREPYHLYPGTVLNNKYTIGTVIGFGGFGVIYKAWDNNLNRVVAVKEYYPTTFLSRIEGEKQVHIYDSKNTDVFEKGKREFLEEARNLAKFNQHPVVVNIYDFFEENGTAYFVMEYLDGCSLKDIMADAAKRGKRLSVKTALQITQAVLGALKAVHSSNIIHRDIKPGNIFVCKNGTVKLIDFGAARFSDQDTEKTRTIIITPGYAPAEQYQTNSKQGPFTDIYAIAAVLYEMLTGIKPDESINRKVEDNVEHPRNINKDVSKALSNAVMRAMAVNQEIRFQNVDQFAKALIATKAVRDARGEIRYRRNKRNLKIAVIFLFIALITGVANQTYQRDRLEAVLEECEIELWAPYNEENGIDSATALYQTMLEEFNSDYTQVKVNIKLIEESQYKAELLTALQSETGPDVFDSTCLTPTDYEQLEPLDKFFEFSEYDESQYYLLDRYEQWYPSKKQLPLSLCVTVRYGNSLQENLADDYDYEKYLNSEANYIGTIYDYEKIQEDMAGIYTIDTSMQNVSNHRFTNLWSVNTNASEQEKNAAIRVLYYFLSEISQEELTVLNNNGLPLNKNIMTIYTDVNNDFSYILDYIDSLEIFGGEHIIRE